MLQEVLHRIGYNTCSDRIQALNAVSIKFESCTLLLCSVYIPRCAKLCSVDTRSDVTQTLAHLTDSSTYDLIIIGGDFNCCLTDRTKKSVKEMSQFTENENLFCVSDISHSHNIKYTFECKANKLQSFIDHFFLAKIWKTVLNHTMFVTT